MGLMKQTTYKSLLTHCYVSFVHTAMHRGAQWFEWDAERKKKLDLHVHGKYAGLIKIYLQSLEN